MDVDAMVMGVSEPSRRAKTEAIHGGGDERRLNGINGRYTEAEGGKRGEVDAMSTTMSRGRGNERRRMQWSEVMVSGGNMSEGGGRDKRVSCPRTFV